MKNNTQYKISFLLKASSHPTNYDYDNCVLSVRVQWTGGGVIFARKLAAISGRWETEAKAGVTQSQAKLGATSVLPVELNPNGRHIEKFKDN
jgi:hypothetical protein